MASDREKGALKRLEECQKECQRLKESNTRALAQVKEMDGLEPMLKEALRKFAISEAMRLQLRAALLTAAAECHRAKWEYEAEPAFDDFDMIGERIRKRFDEITGYSL